MCQKSSTIATFCIAIWLVLALSAQAQPFTEVDMGLPGICCGSVAWGDYDSDGDLDLLATGISGEALVARIYRNEGDLFTDIDAGLPGVYEGAAAWGDYDNDGDLDVVISGALERSGSEENVFIARIYRNEGGRFIDIEASLTGAVSTALDWGDYDNDGDLDLILNGRNSPDPSTWLYRNDHNDFTEIPSPIEGADLGSVNWGDYDSDGDLDVIVTGRFLGPTDDTPPRTRLYQNEPASFVNIETSLIPVQESASAWGDFDSDGDLDIILAGQGESDSSTFFRATRLYSNQGGNFTSVQADVIATTFGSVAWGDYDNDGDLDLVITGIVDQGGSICYLYRNDSSVFTKVDQDFPGVSAGEAIWGDYDNDGDLDLLIAGDGNGGPSRIAHLYRNDRMTPNQSPATPVNLRLAAIDARHATLCWEASSDDTTPKQALSYNLSIGTVSGKEDVKSPMALIGGGQDGQRLVVAHGNVGQRTCYSIQRLTPNTTYYARIQALDHSFASSAFSEEVLFSTDTYVANDPSPDMTDAFRLDAIYPNPFVTTTTIRYALPQHGYVVLRVFDLSGRERATLIDEYQQAGHHQVEFDGTPLPYGAYLLRLETPTQASIGKLVMRLR